MQSRVWNLYLNKNRSISEISVLLGMSKAMLKRDYGLK